MMMEVMMEYLILLAKFMTFFGIVIGVVLFAYANWFIVKRLWFADKKMTNQETKDAIITPSIEIISPPTFDREALFYRFVDTKLEIISSVVSTQNKLLLLAAETGNNMDHIIAQVKEESKDSMLEMECLKPIYEPKLLELAYLR